MCAAIECSTVRMKWSSVAGAGGGRGEASWRAVFQLSEVLRSWNCRDSELLVT